MWATTWLLAKRVYNMTKEDASVKFSTTILKFGDQGEKTGWSYIEIGKRQAEKMSPGNKKSFRVKGKLDSFEIEKTAILPMGDGNFILPLNAMMRKGTGKKAGDKITVELMLDARNITLDADFLQCLKDDDRAYTFFRSLPRGHQNYFSKWIQGAKTISTKTKRITMAVIALAQEQGYPEMMRANKNSRQ